jgi:predicted AlkP superfamily pyrophosphatase or phosphodiesterase
VKERTVVFVVCDAVRGDYLNEEDSSFLLSLTKKGIYVKKLKPSIGFCERTEMFSGARPEISGYFTALTFDEEKSGFSKISRLELGVIKFLKKISSLLGTFNPFLDKAFNYVAIDNLYLKKLVKITQPTYNIPLEFIREVALTEDYIEMCNRNALSVETIFDMMVGENKSFLYKTFASLRMDVGYSDDARIKRMLLESQKRRYDLHLLYLGEGDGIGHRYGPNSKERREMMKRTDERIGRVVKFFENAYNDVDFLIVGDHGMVQVNKYINAFDKIKNIARNNELKINVDYKFFLDSTLIRIWFNSKKAEIAFRELFRNDDELNEYGKIITEKEITRYHLPKNVKYYGDLIWLADPGVVVFPDFFHNKEKVKGMHGYDPSINEQKGFAILYSKNETYTAVTHGERELIDICPTLCDPLGIRYPKSNRGKSLVTKNDGSVSYNQNEK